jgi:hypothetical protein
VREGALSNGTKVTFQSPSAKKKGALLQAHPYQQMNAVAY